MGYYLDVWVATHRLSFRGQSSAVTLALGFTLFVFVTDRSRSTTVTAYYIPALTVQWKVRLYAKGNVIDRACYA